MKFSPVGQTCRVCVHFEKSVILCSVLIQVSVPVTAIMAMPGQQPSGILKEGAGEEKGEQARLVRTPNL